MKKIIIITGLTASGKSELADSTAKKYNGAIISADSVQIYKGLDIGSAKESIDVRKQIPHYLIDIKNFDEDYDVGQFVLDCENAINNIISNGQLPIVVGGTGLYIKALINGFNLGENRANLIFREKYERLANEFGKDYVWNELYKLNPEKAKSVHPNNLKRVIRYLELELNKYDENTQSVQSGCNASGNKSGILNKFKVLKLAIIDDRNVIYDKINKRVDRMIEQGLEKEMSNLIRNGATRNTHSTNSIGYKEWFDYFEGKQDYQTTVNLIKQHSRNYCKRQFTFLKTIPDLTFCTKSEAEEKIKEFMND